MELKPCPFCGEQSDLQVLNKGDEVDFDCHYTCEKQQNSIFRLNQTWFINCPTCGADGPYFYVGGTLGCKTDEEAKEKAVSEWNSRKV